MMFRAIICIGYDAKHAADSKHQLITRNYGQVESLEKVVRQVIASLKGPFVATGYSIEMHVPGIGWTVYEAPEED